MAKDVKNRGASRSQPYVGVVHPDVWEVLAKAHRQPLRLESNAAREFRYAIAFAASMGWLTVVHLDGKTWGREWRITAEGIFAAASHISETYKKP